MTDEAPDWPALVRAVLEHEGIAAVALARRLRVNDRTVRRWLAGDRTPMGRNAQDLVKMAQRAERKGGG